MIMLGSYNRFDRNIYRDTWIVSGIDTFAGLLAGATIFAFLGNLAGSLDVEIEKVALTENNFAIILFAQGVSTFEGVPQLFSIIFFLILALIGVGTAAAYVGAVIAVISDQFPQAVRYRAISVVCVVGSAVGLLYVTPGGSIMTRLADYFGAKVVVCVMALVEVVGVAWVYGIDHFLTDIEFMLKIRLGWYWKFCWCYFIPISIFGILFYAVLDGDHSPLYKGTNFSGMTLSFGWMFSLLAISAVPISAYYVLKSSKATGFLEKMRDATSPSEDWGPQRSDLRREWNDFKKSKRPEP
jgi:solute carrier family 6 amino acid transporter-like protein 5/7/9/14